MATSTSIYLLLRDPIKWERLVNEICSQFQSADRITVQSTLQTPYLEAIINKTMRVRHPTPSSMPRSIPPEGRVVDGQVNPEN